MPPLSLLLAIGLTFTLAGLVKGVAGMGLPTVAMGLLGLALPPAEAASLLVIPSLVTNVWQFAAGPRRRRIARRLWTMQLGVAAATWAATGLLTGGMMATAMLGVALALYALVGLAAVRLAVPARAEPVLSPIVGVATGVVTGVTGVFVLPAGPYLQALGFERDDLVQALGLSFTVSTVALAAGLASHGAFHLGAVGASVLCTAPALVGMLAGQALRGVISPTLFRRLFFAGLLVLGADLVMRSIV